MDTINESIKKTHHLVCVEGKLACLLEELLKYSINLMILSNGFINRFNNIFNINKKIRFEKKQEGIEIILLFC